MNRRPTFFTSDWHIGHENVINFSNRPFKNKDDMANSLVRRFNSCVGECGITYFLGDFSMGSFEETREVLSQLNGTKICVVGNHDRGVNSLNLAGFDAVVHRIDLIIAKEKVSLTHCPLRGITREDMANMKGAREGEHWHGESRHVKFSCEDEGQFHLHGHIHSPNNGRSKKTLGRQYDVGVDANNYMPVSISTIERWIAEVKRNERKD